MDRIALRLRNPLPRVAWRGVLMAVLIVAQSPVAARARATPPDPGRPFIVAIDAGHGGQDIGAEGANGLLEKEVVLSIAKKLASLMRKTGDLQAIMVRESDQYVDLRQRAQIAHKARADLFISLHADAFDDVKARGSSVFILSETGASSEAAQWLARHEKGGQIGGVDLEAHESVLANVLLDLSKNANQEASEVAAQKILEALQDDFTLHNPTVQKANFAVLKSLDVPSLLVETAFITNPEEASRLSDPRHQERLAHALLRGIRAYALEARPALAGASKREDESP